MQNLLATIILKLGDKLIDYLGELFKKWLAEQKDKDDVSKCMDKNDPIERSECLSNELNSH